MRGAAAPAHASTADLLVGALLFASTLYFSSNALLLLPLLLLLLTSRPIPFRNRGSLLLVAGFLVLALLNLVFHLDEFDPTHHSSALAVVLIVFVATLAPSIPERALKVFVIATCIEVFVGAFEYQIGQIALTAAQANLADQELSLESSLLYDLRVFGLSANSSVFAEKVFISLVLTLSVPGMFKRPSIPLALLALGLYLSFNRTAIVCSIVFLVLSIRRHHLSRARLTIGALAMLAAIGLVLLNLESVIMQVTRGSVDELSHSELSRLYFWERAWTTIVENPFFGNGSLTFRVDDLVTGLPQHAHNSFLMLLATHGPLPAALLLIYVAVNLNRFNWRAASVFLLFSLTQYFVFWNLSVPDLVFYWFLGQASARSRPGPVMRTGRVSTKMGAHAARAVA